MRALVIGAAVSGTAAMRLLTARGHRVTVYDADPDAAAALVGSVAAHGGTWEPRLLDGIDVVVVSPGVPEHAAPIQDALAAGLPVWSEIELAARHLDVPMAAVTGTNGKTTVTALAAAMLEASGKSAAAVGNIGDPLCDAVGTDRDVLVVEASSFQLRFIDTFRAHAAVLLNVAPDHLDWHGTVEAYAAAKARIWERQGTDDVIIFDSDDPGAVAAVAGAPSRRVPVSGHTRPSGGLGPEDGALRIGDLDLPLNDLSSTDAAFVVDTAAAAAVALVMGGTPAGVAAAATTFQPAAHRRQVVGNWDGVAWVDDSKATNPHAAAAAIRSYPSVVLIAGGRNKGLDVGALGIERNVKFVVGLGEAGSDVVATAAAGAIAANLDEAVALADRHSVAGDTVLLAPGCASFDMFDSYSDRGDQFAAAVLERKEAT